MADSRQIAGDMAGEIVNTFTSRGQVYGPPEINFSNIAAFWNAWLNSRYNKEGIPEHSFTLDAIDVANMSSLIKKARLANTPDHADSALDDAVYTLLGSGVARRTVDKTSVLDLGDLDHFTKADVAEVKQFVSDAVATGTIEEPHAAAAPDAA